MSQVKQSSPHASGTDRSATLLSLVSLASLVGAGFGIYLSQHFYELKSGSASFSSACKLGETLNCDVVSASKFAELLPGFPLASFAAAFFVAVFIISLLARAEEWRAEGKRALLLLGATGTVISLVYLAIMVGVLKMGCLFCLGIDAANVAILGLSLALKPEPLKSRPLDSGRWKALAAIPIVSLVVVAGGLKASFSEDLSQFPTGEIVQNTLSQPVVAVQSGPEFPSIGPKDAPFTIVEFSDFQCPHCQRAAMTFHNLQLRHPGQVRVVLRNYPLDGSCNSKIQGDGHKAACIAARGAFCAQKLGKFAAYYEHVFENQASITSDSIPVLAKEAGLDEAGFNSCLNSDEAKGAVARDIEEGDSLGVEGTPTVFINGRRAGAFPLPVWEIILDRSASAVTQSASNP